MLCPVDRVRDFELDDSIISGFVVVGFQLLSFCDFSLFIFITCFDYTSTILLHLHIAYTSTSSYWNVIN